MVPPVLVIAVWRWVALGRIKHRGLPAAAKPCLRGDGAVGRRLISWHAQEMARDMRCNYIQPRPGRRRHADVQEEARNAVARRGAARPPDADPNRAGALHLSPSAQRTVSIRFSDGGVRDGLLLGR